ncbi:nuclear transport factor 2 family protein [Olivibacter sitiensis]|uniref:nuclear transport factor 2 family protein n=1 Tax=Olivibacter sitiensis TaxID=376470 RepID=UPI0012FCF068|nr:nuclear transport factor 2 family protein [Olivibacter sitiensis]
MKFIRHKVLAMLMALFLTGFSFAQEKVQQAWEQLIANEWQFAQMALEASIKEAFEHYLSPDGILFNGGMPINGLKLYQMVPLQKEQELKWHPTYGRISSSGDMGFTCGPFTYSEERGGVPQSKGYFFSIWKRRDSTYRLLLDGGVVHEKNTAVNLSAASPLYGREPIDDAVPSFVQTDQNIPEEEFAHFCTIAREWPARAYRQYLSAVPLLLRSSWPLLTSSRAVFNYLSEQSAKFHDYEVLGEGKSVDGEFHYYYGRLHIRHKASALLESGYFVQVWQSEKEGWKIVADVYQADLPKET